MKYKWFPGFRTKAHAVAYKGKASRMLRPIYRSRNNEYAASCECGMATACGRSIWCSPKEVKKSYKTGDKCKTCLRLTGNK